MTVYLKREAIAQVVSLARMLTDAQVERLSTALADGSLTLTAGALTVQQASNLPTATTGPVVALLRQWHTGGGTADTLAAALLSARAAHCQAETEASQAHLVWTGPVSAAVPARSTLSVLLELIDTAQHEIVIVGYALTEGASEVFAHLGAARQRGVRVVIIGNQLEQRLELIRTSWPDSQQMPELYTRPVSPDDPQSALHAKLAVADKQRMLVTSANLTYHGLSGNVEVGVLVEGNVAAEAVQLINRLIAEGVVVRLDAGGIV
jgi:phosphatidylserine/phosphatidylglycerophosphate/cardiolipin synthase-like enzyme